MPSIWSPTSGSPKSIRRISVSAWRVRVVKILSLSTFHQTEPTIAYPDGHPDGETDRETEFQHLKAKVDAGANFIVTQLFYDVDAFLEWVKEIRARGSVDVSYGIRLASNRTLYRDHGADYPWDYAVADLRVFPSDNETLWHLCTTPDSCGPR